jgi:L,D-peptidoglycan transpeptidase YkuD (ErfK/YbiS/YcfS/YnhG family)
MPHPPDNGAGIFLHDDMAVGYTEGCVALPNAELDAVLGWLNPADSPHALIAVG